MMTGANDKVILVSSHYNFMLKIVTKIKLCFFSQILVLTKKFRHYSTRSRNCNTKFGVTKNDILYKKFLSL